MPKRQPNYVKICMILEKHEELDKDELFRLAREDGVFAPESALSERPNHGHRSTPRLTEVLFSVQLVS